MDILNRINNKIRLAFTISSLGSDILNKLKIFCLVFWLPIKKRLKLRNSIGIKISLKKFNKTFYFYLTDSIEFSVLEEVFIKEEYKLDLDKKPKIIFDLGSNVGFASIYFKIKYPEAKIYAFEPDPVTFNKLKNNIEQFRNIAAFNFAVSDMDRQKIRFYIYPNSNVGSSLVERLPNQKYIDVESRSLESLIKQFNIDSIDLLKFDVEGAEFKILNSSIDIFKKIHNLIGEVHLDLMGCTKDSFLGILNNDFEIKIFDLKNNRLIITGLSKTNYK